MEINIHELSAFLKENEIEDYNVPINRELILQFGVRNIAKLTGLPVEQVTEIATQNPRNPVAYTGKKRGRKSAAEKAAMEAAQGGGIENGGFSLETPKISDEDFSDEPEAEAESAESAEPVEAVAVSDDKPSKKRR